jgi:hypothetical protein
MVDDRDFCLLGGTMYVLWLDKTERDYLLSVIRNRRGENAKQLANQLRTTPDVFGVAMWSDEDVSSALREAGVPVTPANVRSIRSSHYGRHIQDYMIERGWELLEVAVSALGL